MTIVIVGQCDSCGADNRVLYRSSACGAEGAFCAKCTGHGSALRDDEIDCLEGEIEDAVECGDRDRAHRLELALCELRMGT